MPQERTNPKYKRGDVVMIKGTQYSSPEEFLVASVVGDGQYLLCTESGEKVFDGRIFLERDLESFDVIQPVIRTRSVKPRSRGVAEQQTELGSLQGSVQTDEKKPVEFEPGPSYKTTSDNEPSVKPTKGDLNESEPSASHKGTNVHKQSETPSSKTLIRAGALDSVGDIAVVTGHETELTETGSVLSRFFARGVFSRLYSLPSLYDAKSFKSKSLLLLLFWGECPLEKGKTRVRWRCVCGRKMYDDFIEVRPGAAAEFEKWLNYSIRNHARTDASNPSQDATSRSSTSSSAAVSGQQQTAGSDISLQPSSWTASTMPDSNTNAAVTIDVHLEKCWLLICGRPRRGPDSLLTQLDLSFKPSDQPLFDGMKKFHSSLRNTFTLQPVLKGVQTIRFVQFQLHKMARVDIRKSPDMPPETMRDEYLYEPCDLIPPVGENLMTHWFQHPEEAWDLPYAYSLFPKKRKGQLDIDLNQGPSVAWGIQIVEGWLASRIWLLGLSLFLCGSLAFGICWTIFKHDIQGAFGVSAYIVALLTLAIGAAQASFG